MCQLGNYEVNTTYSKYIIAPYSQNRAPSCTEMSPYSLRTKKGLDIKHYLRIVHKWNKTDILPTWVSPGENLGCMKSSFRNFSEYDVCLFLHQRPGCFDLVYPSTLYICINSFDKYFHKTQFRALDNEFVPIWGEETQLLMSQVANCQIVGLRRTTQHMDLKMLLDTCFQHMAQIKIW